MREGGGRVWCDDGGGGGEAVLSTHILLPHFHWWVFVFVCG